MIASLLTLPTLFCLFCSWFFIFWRWCDSRVYWKNVSPTVMLILAFLFRRHPLKCLFSWKLDLIHPVPCKMWLFWSFHTALLISPHMFQKDSSPFISSVLKYLAWCKLSGHRYSFFWWSDISHTLDGLLFMFISFWGGVPTASYRLAVDGGLKGWLMRSAVGAVLIFCQSYLAERRTS